MLYLVPHDNLCIPIIDVIMTIIINVLKFFLPFYVFVRTEKKILKHRVGFTYDGWHPQLPLQTEFPLFWEFLGILKNSQLCK